MDMHKELIKKVTILFNPSLYVHLSHVAKQRGVSLGYLVRTACEAQYGSTITPEERQHAAEALRELSLPVSDPLTMKQESVPSPKTSFR